MAEIITRRNLPHWYVSGATFFITYRLNGMLPTEALDRLRSLRVLFDTQRPAVGETRYQQRIRMHKQWFAAYDAFLDRGSDRAWLRDPRVAAMIRGNLYHHHGSKYRLLAYCIMPNHVHVLLQPIEGWDGKEITEDEQSIGEREDGVSPLSKIMHSLKSYTAHEANKLLRRDGPFWQRKSYDHWVRDEDELERIVFYIQSNPVSAGLVARAEDWYWCSCHDRFLADGESTAWLNLTRS